MPATVYQQASKLYAFRLHEFGDECVMTSPPLQPKQYQVVCPVRMWAFDGLIYFRRTGELTVV